MKKYKRDLVFAAAVLAAVILSGCLIRLEKGKNKEENSGGILEITIDGELYGNFPLKEDREVVVTSSYGSNTVVIEQGRASVTEADCPDKVCAGMQEIGSDGEVICCLPHRLFLTVRGGNAAEYDAAAY